MLRGHSKAVTTIAWSPTAPRSSPRLFSGSADGTLIVWDATTGAKLRRLRGHRGIVNSVACTRAGREILVSGGDDGKVCLWDPEDREPLDTIPVSYPVTAVAFSQDGSQVFVGGLDNDIHVSVSPFSFPRHSASGWAILRVCTDKACRLSLLTVGSVLGPRVAQVYDLRKKDILYSLRGE